MHLKAGRLHFAIFLVSGLLGVCALSPAATAQDSSSNPVAVQAPVANPGQDQPPASALAPLQNNDDTITDVPVTERQVQIIGLGDSLMAGYQLPGDQSLTSQLEKALQDKGLNVSIGDAGVSGDTSEGGLSRVDWSVPDGTDGVILELGANDALRGIAPEETERNLAAIIQKLQARKIAVLLVGMIAPPNMGVDYGRRFNPIYKRLADKYHLAFYPFILQGVATNPKLKLSDGMHPNAEGVKVMVHNMLPTVLSFAKALADKHN
ncbi:arylesterase [Allorhizobium sp. BGMRC 0089]|uniref:arylesterase n=1 Tax=Allorhizobium sonneratiae TaxID=2934936 RepID=UPI002033D527|nr:arylesterase [Allorhizobium sonneratiae]MCM2293375.1 arylesterase [Allorhizobium sonneratiae]